MFFLSNFINKNYTFVNKQLVFFLIGILLIVNFLTSNFSFFYSFDNKFSTLVGSDFFFSYILIFIIIMLMSYLYFTSTIKKYSIFFIFLTLIFSLKYFFDLKQYLSSILIPIISMSFIFFSQKIIIKKKQLKFLFYFIFILANIIAYKLHVHFNTYLNIKYFVFFNDFIFLSSVNNFFLNNFQLVAGPTNHLNCFVYLTYLCNIFFLKKNTLNLNKKYLFTSFLILISYLLFANTYIAILSIFTLVIFLFHFNFLVSKKFIIFFFVFISFSSFLYNKNILSSFKNLVNFYYSLNLEMEQINCSEVKKNMSLTEAMEKFSLSDYEVDVIYSLNVNNEIKKIENLPNCINKSQDIKFIYIGFAKRTEFFFNIYSQAKQEFKTFLFIGLSKKSLDFLFNNGSFPHNSYLYIIIKYGLLYYILFVAVVAVKLFESKNSKAIIFFVLLSSSQVFDDYLLGNRSEFTFVFWYLLSIFINKKYNL